MNSAAPPSYWDSLYTSSKLAYMEERVEFKDIFARHLPRGGKCFEIGCYPGDFLVYLCKTFGYEAHGIDTTPDVEDGLVKHFSRLGVAVGRLSKQDLFTYQSDDLYDVVCSFGLVEHFENYREVLRMHVPFVKPGGWLFISCPNFRYAQFLLHRIFDNENLKRHVLSAMNIKSWRVELQAVGMEVVDSGYCRTFDFWVENQQRGKFQEMMIRWIRRYGAAFDRRVSFPNRMSSPFMYCLARKPL